MAFNKVEVKWEKTMQALNDEYDTFKLRENFN